MYNHIVTCLNLGKQTLAANLMALCVVFGVLMPESTAAENRLDKLQIYWSVSEGSDNKTVGPCYEVFKKWIVANGHQLASDEESANLLVAVHAAHAPSDSSWANIQLQIFSGKKKCLLATVEIGLNTQKEFGEQFEGWISELMIVKGNKNPILVSLKNKEKAKDPDFDVWTMPDIEQQVLARFEWRESDTGNFPDYYKGQVRDFLARKGINEGLIRERAYFVISLKYSLSVAMPKAFRTAPKKPIRLTKEMLDGGEAKQKIEAIVTYGTAKTRRALSKHTWDIMNRDYKKSEKIGQQIRSTVHSATAPVNQLIEFRTWSDRSGNFSIEAAYVSHYQQDVFLRKKSDGKLIPVPIAKLSDDDRKYIFSKR